MTVELKKSRCVSVADTGAHVACPCKERPRLGWSCALFVTELSVLRRAGGSGEGGNAHSTQPQHAKNPHFVLQGCVLAGHHDLQLGGGNGGDGGGGGAGGGVGGCGDAGSGGGGHEGGDGGDIGVGDNGGSGGGVDGGGGGVDGGGSKGLGGGGEGNGGAGEGDKGCGEGGGEMVSQ